MLMELYCVATPNNLYVLMDGFCTNGIAESSPPFPPPNNVDNLQALVVVDAVYIYRKIKLVYSMLME